MEYIPGGNTKINRETLKAFLTDTLVCRERTFDAFADKVLSRADVFIKLSENEPLFALIALQVSIKTYSGSFKAAYIIPAVKEEGLYYELTDDISGWLGEIAGKYAADCLIFSPNDEVASQVFGELGFKDSFFEKKLRITGYSAKVLASKLQKTESELNYSDYSALSDKYKNPHIQWDEDVFSYFLSSAHDAGGTAVSFSVNDKISAYMLGKKSSPACLIFETVGDSAALSLALSYFAGDEEIGEFEIFLPLDYKLSADNMEILSGAMLKYENERAERALSGAALHMGYNPWRRILYK